MGETHSCVNVLQVWVLEAEDVELVSAKQQESVWLVCLLFLSNPLSVKAGRRLVFKHVRHITATVEKAVAKENCDTDRLSCSLSKSSCSHKCVSLFLRLNDERTQSKLSLHIHCLNRLILKRHDFWRHKKFSRLILVWFSAHTGGMWKFEMYSDTGVVLFFLSVLHVWWECLTQKSVLFSLTKNVTEMFCQQSLYT